MSVVDPGDGVLELVQSAKSKVTIVAPYIKSYTLRALVVDLPESVTEFICVTRWLPEDIASGVCDIEIYDDVLRHAGGELRIHPHLHAKFFSNGQECLVGSANITGRGLGWHTPSNLELLVSLDYSFPGISEWESSLLSSSIVVTSEMRDQLREEAERIKTTMPQRLPPEVEDSDASHRIWIPSCPVPDRLWMIYQGQNAESIVTSAFEAAQSDLLALSPPSGLNKELFEAYISGILRQMPFISEIDQLASTGVTDTQAVEFLSTRLEVDSETSEHNWRVLKSWLIHFFADSYRLETGQDVLVKGKELPRR